MKFIFIIDKLARGGAPMHLRQLLPALKERGDMPVLFTLKDDFNISPEFEEKGIEVINLNIDKVVSLKSFWSLFKIIRHIRHKSPDCSEKGIKNNQNIIVVSYLFSSTMLGYMLKTVYPYFKYVVAWRDTGYWLDDRRREWLVKACRKADGLTANSDAVLNAASSITGANCPPVYKIYNGVTLPEIDFSAKKYKKEKKSKKLVLGMMARFCPEKGHDILVKSADELRNAGMEFSVMLGGEGETLQSIKDMVAEYGLNDYFDFVGKVDDIGPFYEKIDVLVAPSRSEGFSNSILEAMAYGIPVVGTIAGGIPEAVVKNETGLLFNVGNYESLTEKITMLINDRKYLLELGLNARKRVEDHFSTATMAEKMAAAFTKILERCS